MINMFPRTKQQILCTSTGHPGGIQGQFTSVAQIERVNLEKQIPVFGSNIISINESSVKSSNVVNWINI